MNPELISDIYRKMGQMEAETRDWARETCEALMQSEAFQGILRAVQLFAEKQLRPEAPPEEVTIGVLGGVMASGFQLGLLVGEARCIEIVQSHCDGLCGAVSSDLAEFLHGLGLSIRDLIEKELGP